MTVQRSERFDTDAQRQFRWYLLETDLDPVDAMVLAARFADAVDAGLEFLKRNHEVGRRRFRTYPDLVGTRSWKLPKPFSRFMIFYWIEGKTLFAETAARRRLPISWRTLRSLAANIPCL